MMNRLMPTKLNVLSPIAAVALALGMFGISPNMDAASAQEQPSRNLTVTGQGIVSIPTTLTEVRLGVEVQGRTAQEVQQEVARRSQALVELLRSRNVEKLQTTGIQLNPLYRSNDNAAPTITGYSASNIVSFRLPTDRAGTLLDEAVMPVQPALMESASPLPMQQWKPPVSKRFAPPPKTPSPKRIPSYLNSISPGEKLSKSKSILPHPIHNRCSHAWKRQQIFPPQLLEAIGRFPPQSP